MKKLSQHDQKVTKKATCASRESNPVPPDPRSEDHPTRLFSHQNTASRRDLYASKICHRCVCIPAGAFSAPETTTSPYSLSEIEVLAPGGWRGVPMGGSRASWREMCQNHCVLQCLSSRPPVSLAFWRPDLHFDWKFTAT